MHARPESRPLIAAAVTLVLWASAFVAIRHLGSTFRPGSLSLGRLAVGALALGVASRGRSWVSPTRSEWLRLVAIGLLWFGFYNVALNAGERRVDAGSAALLVQTAPIMVAVLAAAFLGERATAALWSGSVVAFAGVAIIASAAGGSARFDVAGVLLCVAAAAAYAVSLVLQKTLMSRLPALQVTWSACTVGLIGCLPFAGQLVSDVRAAPAADVGWVIYLGVFPTAIAFTLYAFALRHMGAGQLSITTYLVPVITVVLAAVVLSETPPLAAYVGGALALAGVALTRRTPRSARR